MDIDSENEEFADLHIDLSARERDLTGKSNLRWDIFAGFDSIIDEFLEEGCLSHLLAYCLLIVC